MCKISCLRVVLDEDTGTKGTRKVLHTLNGTITNCLTGTLQAMVVKSAGEPWRGMEVVCLFLFGAGSLVLA